MKTYIGIPAVPWDIERANPPVTTPVSLLPQSVKAGQVVTLAGTVVGRYPIVCEGTPDNPAWILGLPALRLTGEISITGSYGIIDGLTVAGAHGLHLSGDHLVIRHSDISGTVTDRQTAGLGLSGSNIVAYQNKVHHHGDVGATFDQDAHGISVSRASRGIWILENECWANSGDGINCNPYPYDASGLTAISYVFIGGNRCHDNKQTGIWCKQSTDIIVSSNEVYGHHASDSSRGDGMGYQYSTNKIWYLNNDIHDNDVGIGVSEAFDNGNGPPNGCSIIGNRIARANGTSCGQGDIWSCAAIYLTGDAYTYVVNNTITDSIDGIHAQRGKGLHVSGTVGNTHVISTNPVIPLADLAARFFEAYGRDISSLLAGVTPDPPPPPPLPKCSTISNPLLRFLAFVTGRCVR